MRLTNRNSFIWKSDSVPNIYNLFKNMPYNSCATTLFNESSISITIFLWDYLNLPFGGWTLWLRDNTNTGYQVYLMLLQADKPIRLVYWYLIKVLYNIRLITSKVVNMIKWLFFTNPDKNISSAIPFYSHMISIF